jgi:hypothetical protein
MQKGEKGSEIDLILPIFANHSFRFLSRAGFAVTNSKKKFPDQLLACGIGEI